MELCMPVSILVNQTCNEDWMPKMLILCTVRCVLYILLLEMGVGHGVHAEERSLVSTSRRLRGSKLQVVHEVTLVTFYTMKSDWENKTLAIYTFTKKSFDCVAGSGFFNWWRLRCQICPFPPLSSMDGNCKHIERKLLHLPHNFGKLSFGPSVFKRALEVARGHIISQSLRGVKIATRVDFLKFQKVGGQELYIISISQCND